MESGADKIPLSVFDFDGTLTRGDTLLPFMAFACGRRRVAALLFRFLPQLLLMLAGLADNGRLKERLFGCCFKGMEEARFARLCRRFAAEGRYEFRSEAVAKLREKLDSGEQVMVVSASVETLVRACMDTLSGAGGAVRVVATRAAVSDGCLTGLFAGRNCYGAEKVERLREALGAEREQFYITAYGDSRGDKELLDDADEGCYRWFR